MQCRMQLQVQQMHDCALCNMQLANFCSHTILNARLHCVNFANFALYFLYHYHLHCIVLHVQCFQCLLIRQGCCATENFAHAAKQTYFQMKNATVPLVLPPTLSFAFLARQSGLAPLRIVHSLVLLTAPWVPHLQLNCCIQCYSACLPAILAPIHHHISSTYLGSLDNLHVCGLFCHT